MLYLPINEIFSSIQGEGPYVGVRQIFLRLPGCNLTCPYCDTFVDKLPRLSMEVIPGSRTFQYYDNPLELKFLLDLLLKFNFVRHHSLSFTGGEPLLWNRELAQFIPLVKEKGLKIYLETNGTLPDRLDSLLPLLDIISMDIKLPFNGQVFWNEHCRFLIKSKQVKNFFIKIVLSNTSQFSDIKTARELIADIDPDIPTILQPVTAVRETVPPKPRQMLEWQDYFLESLKNVRIIPQTHILQGQL
ncbi:MAG: 7-carboxy-7-deazaguanine synthase QueE [Desulfitobacteriaceae bacterium]|nr:7-carboxy-7-deazaguanine synthase QueE [Desulfitobacteriaceae bacterium]MDD4346988.1 7-carboxy-7-deazaguanine synthase QueE [Desulfitobacteriaceae bacterium]MDD4401717.1 7-carboxy-7-deazaguanine synthase QueE [Desulfitobacteriaceae bacterium]